METLRNYEFTDLPVCDGEAAFHERDMRVVERVGRPLGSELNQAEPVGRLGEQLPLDQFRRASVNLGTMEVNCVQFVIHVLVSVHQ